MDVFVYLLNGVASPTSEIILVPLSYSAAHTVYKISLQYAYVYNMHMSIRSYFIFCECVFSESSRILKQFNLHGP